VLRAVFKRKMVSDTVPIRFNLTRLPRIHNGKGQHWRC
jgi:hypothetical protein